MLRQLASVSGISGALLFVTTVVVGGALIEGYDHRSQFISESYALGTKHGLALRFFGYLPSGLLIALFAWAASRVVQANGAGLFGFAGVGVFYGLGTVVTALFPCEAGCEVASDMYSLTQTVHNISGLLTYVFVPIGLLLIGAGLRRDATYAGVRRLALICGVVALVAVGIFFVSVDTAHRGVVQRLVEGTVLLWIVGCAWTLRSSPH